MQITFSPQRRDDTLTVTKQGDALTINGTVYDFSVIPDGATLPKAATDCSWLASDVERIDGVLYLSLVLPNGITASEAARFPDPLIDPADGALELPDQAISGITEKTSGVIDLDALIFPTTPAEALAAERAAMVCSPAQIRLTLLQLGLLDTVQAIADSDPMAAIVWEYAAEIRRTNALIDALAGDGFTAEQIDDIFRYAMQLVI